MGGQEEATHFLGPYSEQREVLELACNVLAFWKDPLGLVSVSHDLSTDWTDWNGGTVWLLGWRC